MFPLWNEITEHSKAIKIAKIGLDQATTAFYARDDYSAGTTAKSLRDGSLGIVSKAEKDWRQFRIGATTGSQGIFGPPLTGTLGNLTNSTISTLGNYYPIVVDKDTVPSPPHDFVYRIAAKHNLSNPTLKSKLGPGVRIEFVPAGAVPAPTTTTNNNNAKRRRGPGNAVIRDEDINFHNVTGIKAPFV